VIPLKDNIPTDRTALVTIGLIVTNVIAYLLAIRHGGNILTGPDQVEVVKYGAVPYDFTHWGKHCATVITADQFTGSAIPQTICQGRDQLARQLSFLPTWETAFTAMFMHGGIVHIGGNMLFLWIFGNNVEDSMGRLRFLLFYIVGGLVALAVQIAVGPDSTTPTVGASGAIAAVLGAYLVLYPRARVLTLVIIIFFFTVIELPAIAVLLIWFALDALLPALGQIGHTGAGSGGGVAYFAHFGGFVFGLLAIRALAKRRKEIGYGPKYPVY
jgi:membrane associated rhomboid family serine protease